MELFMTIVRILLMILGSFAIVLYVVVQLYRSLPEPKILFRTSDFVFAGIVSFVFAIGTDSYWGTLAGLAILLLRLVTKFFFQLNRLQGNGNWVEVKWQKLTPRGFNLPPDMAKEIAKIPGDKHFLVPRIVSMWFLKYFLNSMKKNAGKSGLANTQQNQAMSMIEGMAKKVTILESGKSEKLSLPFGMLQFKRL